jgi:dTDP-glucose 4,6-dehydratase
MEGHDGEAYNVGSDQAVTIADLAYLVRDLLAPGKPVVFLGQKQGAVARNRYVPSISKIRADYGIKPEFTLEESILHMVSCLTRHEHYCR